MLQVVEEKESVKVLRECMALQLKKSQDYQNPNSSIKQAMHYRRGIDTIHDVIRGKMLRAESLLESSGGANVNFESLEDTYKDIANYCSFAVAWLRGKMEGQEPGRDIFNKPQRSGNSVLQAITSTTTRAVEGFTAPYTPDRPSQTIPCKNAVEDEIDRAVRLGSKDTRGVNPLLGALGGER